MDPDSIREGFPHPVIPMINGKPTYEAITELHRLLNSNAASVYSNLENGTSGNLMLTVTPQVYLSQAAAPFISPFNLGYSPAVPINSARPQIAAIKRQFKVDRKIWEVWINTDKALKGQVFGAVEESFYRVLRNRHTGYAGVNTLQLITYLCDMYDNITPEDLVANDARMKTQYYYSRPGLNLV